MHYFVSVLILSFLKVSLDHFGVVGLEAVWLDLEAIVDLLHVLNVVLNCLGTLLLDRQVAAGSSNS